MIGNDTELKAMQSRVAALEQLLLRLRAGARAEEWPTLRSGYRLKIQRMQGEILDYLVVGKTPALPR